MAESSIQITLVRAWLEHYEQYILKLPSGSTLRQALIAAGGDWARANDDEVGVWGHRVAANTLLNDGDRVEIYRALIADPKQARLRRASEQGYRWQGRTRRAVQKAVAESKSKSEPDH